MLVEQFELETTTCNVISEHEVYHMRRHLLDQLLRLSPSIVTQIIYSAYKISNNFLVESFYELTSSPN